MLHLRVSMTRGSAIPGPRPGAFGWDAGIGSRLDGNDVAHSGPPAQSTREEISWLDSVWEKRLSRNVPRPMMRTARRGGLSTGRALAPRFCGNSRRDRSAVSHSSIRVPGRHAIVGSTEAANDVVARVGVIDRSSREVPLPLDARLYACHPRFVNGYPQPGPIAPFSLLTVEDQ